ncbi:MAG: NAD-dependent epimerase/dehydratase family protein [Mariniphaga sp.]|nr:NAD-dependent epimerase/dehydratase family protein [Mariniphaga sp.]
MKILITGPDGVLGSNLVRELLNREYKISVLILDGTLTPTLDHLPIDRYYGNILNPVDLDLCVRDQDCVIHCAACTRVYPAHDELINLVNIEGSRNIAEACLKHGIKRLIYIGTANSFGYGSTLEDLGKEGNPYTSVKYGLDYMDSKRKAMELILEYVHEKNLPAIIVNPTFMIGPYDSKPSSGQMILALYNGKVPGYTNGGKNYIAVKDAVVATANAVTEGRIGECYILGNENLTYREAFKRFAKVIEVNPPKIRLSNVTVKIFGELNSFLARWLKFKPAITKELAAISCDRHYYSAEKAINELGLPQTPIEVAVKECFEWFRDNNYLIEK